MIGLILANLRRRPGRALITAGGLAAGIGTIVALIAVTDGIKRSAAGFVHLGHADFGLFQSGLSDVTQSRLPLSMVARVREQRGVAQAAPLQLLVDALPGTGGSVLFGLQPGTFPYDRVLLEQGRRPTGPRELMVGDELARRLHLRVGGTLNVKRTPYRITGIYHAGETFEDDGAAVRLAVAQRLVRRRDDVTTIAVVAAPGHLARDVAKRLRHAFPGVLALDSPDAAARADASVRIVSRAVVVVALIALVVGAIAVAMTIVLAVVERQRELALLSAVGWSGWQVATLVLGEGIALSLAAAGLGVGLGVAASESVVGALDVSAIASPDVTAWGVGRALIVGFATGVLGGLYPAWRVTRRPPAELLAQL